jgi:hypothetical protein
MDKESDKIMYRKSDLGVSLGQGGSVCKKY